MLISHKKKFIFIHIFKAGGSSTIELLEEYCTWKYRLTRTLPIRILISILNKIIFKSNHGNRWLYGVAKHASWDEIKRYYSEEVYQNYKKFSIVRNPYTWCISFYDFIKSTKQNPYYLQANSMDILEFLKFYFSKNPETQSSFVCDGSNELMVDRIFKLENLSQNPKEIFEFLEIEQKSFPTVNRSQGSKNVSERLGVEGIQYVNERFKVDFENFSYPMYYNS